MAEQHCISESLATEIKSDILQKINDIKERLDTHLVAHSQVLPSQTDHNHQKRALFIEKAYETVLSHPELLDVSNAVEEFKEHYRLSRDLLSISEQIKKLSNSMDNTLLAANSGALAGALRIYAAIQDNKTIHPELSNASEEMGSYLSRLSHKK